MPRPGDILTDKELKAVAFASRCVVRIKKACPGLMDRIYGKEYAAMSDAIFDEYMKARAAHKIGQR